jgi:predicted RNase H-like nuclease (RuvC/YqgF family)
LSSYIIAGIDPGATVGIAIVSLSGKKIATASTSGGMGDAARIIEKHGTPSLIACDVFPAPEMAVKLASYFSCRLYCPQKEIREEDKRRIAGEARGAGALGSEKEIANNHERDAYTAAVYGYRVYANKLRQIDSLADLSHEEKEKLKHLLLKGYRMTDAFALLSEPVAEVKEEVQTKTTQMRTLSPEEMRDRLSSLARENANLHLAMERMENEKRQLASRLSLLENGVRQSFLRDSELRKLRFQLQKTAERIGNGKKWKKHRQKAATAAQKSWQQKQESNPPKPPAQLIAKAQPQPVSQPAKTQAQFSQPVHAKKIIAPSDADDDLNMFTETKLDLEKLVAEYRKGRSKFGDKF